MAKKFSELRDKMSPESRARSAAKTKEMLSDMEENKVATCDCIRHGGIHDPECARLAPNSPDLTRLSGEQAEERTAREGRKSKPGYENLYWCCAADFGQHEVDCPNVNIERTK